MTTVHRNAMLMAPDGSQEVMSVRVGDDGVVLARGTDLEIHPSDVVIEGGYVSPGWTDLHAHVYWGATDISIRVDEAGLGSGVTTVVDAGSSGEANWKGFRAYVAEGARERLFAFLNIGSIGLVKTNVVSELEGIHSIDLDRMDEVLQENRDLIRGVKIRASHVILREWGLEPFKVARKMARRNGLPLMVHVGEPPPIIEEVLDRLDPGDVLTHCFNGKVGGNILDDRDSLTAARAAYERGVVFDLGHGNASFAFETARRALDLGISPTTVSTDLHGHNIDGPVYDLATTMSKMLHVGMPLGAVVQAVTSAADRVLGNAARLDDWPRIGERLEAVHFEVIEAAHEVKDSMGQTERIERWIAPTRTYFGGDVVPASNRFIARAAPETSQ